VLKVPRVPVVLEVLVLVVPEPFVLEVLVPRRHPRHQQHRHL
jgi:hypothetical protein